MVGVGETFRIMEPQNPITVGLEGIIEPWNPIKVGVGESFRITEPCDPTVVVLGPGRPSPALRIWVPHRDPSPSPVL